MTFLVLYFVAGYFVWLRDEYLYSTTVRAKGSPAQAIWWCVFFSTAWVPVYLWFIIEDDFAWKYFLAWGRLPEYKHPKRPKGYA